MQKLKKHFKIHSLIKNRIECIDYRQYDNMRSYINITKDMIFKFKKNKSEIYIQTDLKLTPSFLFRKLYTTQTLGNQSSCLFEYLNDHLKDTEVKNVYDWDEFYNVSEEILNNKNKLLSATVDYNKDYTEGTIQNACIVTFLNKFPESPSKSTTEIAGYLKVLFVYFSLC